MFTSSKSSAATSGFSLPTRGKRLLLLAGLAVAALLIHPGQQTGRSAAQGNPPPAAQVLIDGAPVAGIETADNEGISSEVVQFL